MEKNSPLSYDVSRLLLFSPFFNFSVKKCGRSKTERLSQSQNGHEHKFNKMTVPISHFNFQVIFVVQHAIFK